MATHWKNSAVELAARWLDTATAARAQMNRISPNQLIQFERNLSTAIVRLPDPASLVGTEWREVILGSNQLILDFVKKAIPMTLIVDFTNISRCCAEGEAEGIRMNFVRQMVFLQAAGYMRRYQGTVRLVGLSANIKEVFTLFRFNEIFELEDLRKGGPLGAICAFFRPLKRLTLQLRKNRRRF